MRADYSELIVFADGRVDSSASQVTVTETDSATVTNLKVTKGNGAHGTVVLYEKEFETTMDVEWTTWDNYYILGKAEYYVDGSGHMHYEIWLNEQAYLDGADPLVVADYYFSSPESGDGTMTYNGEVYNLQFDGSGKATISQNGVSRRINLYY